MLSHEIGRNQIQHFFFAKQSGLCWNTLRRIQVALNKLQLDEETIGIEATSIYGGNLVYALREDGSFSVTSVISMSSIQIRFANSRMLIRICLRMTMWMPSSLPTSQIRQNCFEGLYASLKITSKFALLLFCFF